MTNRSSPEGRICCTKSDDTCEERGYACCQPYCIHFEQRQVVSTADAYMQGHADRYQRDRQPDVLCRNCGKPWAIPGATEPPGGAKVFLAALVESCDAAASPFASVAEMMALDRMVEDARQYIIETSEASR